MGLYVPQGRVTNDYFLNVNGLTSDWIVQRTGIQSRSKAADDENQFTMALEAVSDAISKSPYDIKDVDLIVGASYAVYDSVGTVGHVVQQRHDIAHAKVVYASSACSSFINGLEIVEGYFAMGKATKALLICSEHNTYYSNEADPKSGHLWGDAAVAYLISKEQQAPTDWEILNVFTEGLGNLGKGPGGVMLRPKEDGISMPDGRDVFIHACRYMIYALNQSLAQTGLQISDIDKLITHQANMRIVAQVAHQLDKPLDHFINNITEYGNTGSASAPLVLAQNADAIEPGAKIALMVFGGGYSCGTFIVQKPA